MRKHVKGNVSWVGYIDWELESFHGDDYSIMNGSSQNAYLIEEEKNAGQFYTPSCVVRTIVEILQPFNGCVYENCTTSLIRIQAA